MDPYLIISNKGELPFEFVELLGAGEPLAEDKIRQFHTGMKYAIATATRLNLGIYMATSKWKMGVDTQPITVHKGAQDISFDRVTYRYRNGNGKIRTIPSGYTTDMGANWKEPWFVVREFLSNAIDQEDFSYEVKNVDPWKDPVKTGWTKVYLSYDASVREIFNDFKRYVRLGEGIPIGSRGRIMARIGPKPIIYYKGIRVTELDHANTLFDYELNCIQLSEDRAIVGLYDLRYEIAKLWDECKDESALEELITGLWKSDTIEADCAWDNREGNPLIGKVWKKLHGERIIAETERECSEADSKGVNIVYAEPEVKRSALEYLKRSGIRTVRSVIGDIPVHNIVEADEVHLNNIETAKSVLQFLYPWASNTEVRIFRAAGSDTEVIEEVHKGPKEMFVTQNENIGHDLRQVILSLLRAFTRISKQEKYSDEGLAKKNDIVVEALMPANSTEICVEDDGSINLTKEMSPVSGTHPGYTVPVHVLPDRILLYSKDLLIILMRPEDGYQGTNGFSDFSLVNLGDTWSIRPRVVRIIRPGKYQAFLVKEN